MKYYGIQKLSLVDYDKEIAITLFTRGCNFRCSFCHNFELVDYDKEKSQELDNDKLFEYLKSKVGLVTAVVITGGEPTINKDLVDSIKEIKSLGYKIKLDTNGTNPEVVKYLFENSLIDYLAMDIKNSKEEYAITVGLDSLDMIRIEETVNYLISHNFPYEFRTTMTKERHNEDSIISMGKWLKGAKKLFIQKFEVSDNVFDKTLHSVDEKNALEYKRILEEYIEKVELRGY